MKNPLLQRIDERLKEIGMSRSSASVAAGFSDSYIRDMDRRHGSPTTDNLKKLANVLGVDLEYLLGTPTGPGSKSNITTLPVIGTIEAGQFRDITLIDQDENYPVINVIAQERFSYAKQYALKVSGDSMDEKFPDGCYVTVVDFAESGLSLRPGMTIHVERTIAGTQLVESTLKEVQSINGDTVLIPRSHNPKHKPIILAGGEDTEVFVKGIVTGQWRAEDL